MESGTIKERVAPAFVVDKLKSVLPLLIAAMVDHPEDSSVEFTFGERSIFGVVSVRKTDLGHIIGRQGRNAESIRMVMRAICARYGFSFALEIAEDRI